MLESKFQADLIKDIRVLFPGCIVLKNDANYLQGIPDLIVLFKNRWAALEVKKSYEEMLKCIRANRPPNQEYYVDTMKEMSYAAFVYPENRELILDELQFAFRTRR